MTKYRKKFGDHNVGVGIGSTGRTSADLPNSGISILLATSNEEYTLAAPTSAGIEKTLVSVNTVSAAGPTVWMSTGTGITLSGATSLATATKMVFGASTAPQCVKLVSLSSVLWVVASAFPVAATAPGPTFGTS